MKLPKIRFSKPSFSLRFFIYLLFGLAILVLLAEGGYYFWIQKITQSTNPFIIQREGVFTYVAGEEDGSIQKMIIGVVEEIAGEDEIIIKTENNQRVKVKFIGENFLIVKQAKKVTESKVEKGTLKDILVGDEARASQIETDGKGNLWVKSLIILRKV